MKSRDFCYWLQGYFELINDPQQVTSLTPAQTSMIRNHLALVFKHEIDPSAGDQVHQDVLNQLHRPDAPDGTTYRC